jgi:hypothetical protein
MTTAAPAGNDLSLATVLDLSRRDPVDLLSRMSLCLMSDDADARDRALSFMAGGVEIGGKTALGLARELGLSETAKSIMALGTGTAARIDAAVAKTRRTPRL